MLKVVFPLLLAFGAVSVCAGESARPDEKPADATGSVSGTIHPPGKAAPNGAVAEIHVAQPGGGGEVSYALFADGGVSRQLKDLANKGGSATITGVITKDGYRVTQVSGVGRGK